jgi:biopolymer transport protein ExbD
MASTQGRRSSIVAINMTPMVDVVLVLLVIMMVAAMQVVSQSFKVELPKTATSDDAVPSLVSVTVTKDRAFIFNDEPVDEPTLAKRLATAYQGNNDVSLVISADDGAAHGAVVHVIDLSKIAGITKFALSIERK